MEVAWAGHLLNVEEARALVSLTRRRPWQGDSTVIHVTSAHQVSDDVWNTLLKVLEEPPEYVHFHLYAPSTDAIPRTIRSRSRITRESLPNVTPEDASRLVRLYESGDALALLREGDRHTELASTRRVVESLWIYALETRRLDTAVVAEYFLHRLIRGTSPRVQMKSMLIELAVRFKQLQ